MKKKTKKKQPLPQITPYLLYMDVGRALGWFRKAFGFRGFGERFKGSDGAIHHAAMQLPDGSIFMMGCPGKSYKNPRRLGSVTMMLYVNVDNVDRHYARARKAGAEILEEPRDTPYGDRRYGVADPEGHRWYFAQHVRDVSAAEMKRSMKNR